MGLGLPMELFVEFLQKNVLGKNDQKMVKKAPKNGSFELFLKILSLIFA